MDIKNRYSSPNPLLQSRRLNTNKRIFKSEKYFLARPIPNGAFFIIPKPELRHNETKITITDRKRLALVSFLAVFKLVFSNTTRMRYGINFKPATWRVKRLPLQMATNFSLYWRFVAQERRFILRLTNPNQISISKISKPKFSQNLTRPTFYIQALFLQIPNQIFKMWVYCARQISICGILIAGLWIH